MYSNKMKGQPSGRHHVIFTTVIRMDVTDHKTFSSYFILIVSVKYYDGTIHFITEDLLLAKMKVEFRYQVECFK